VEIWSALLQEQDLRMDAAECLRLFANQKWKSDAIPDPWISNFIRTFGNICFAIISQPRDQDTLLDEYDFHKKLCEVVTGFAQYNFTRLQLNQATEAEMYFTILLQFTKHPSIIMATGMSFF
jgi:hypothetical protein